MQQAKVKAKAKTKGRAKVRAKVREPHRSLRPADSVALVTLGP